MKTKMMMLTVLFGAALAHAQVTVSPVSLTMYPSATAAATVTIPSGWAVVPPVTFGAGISSATINLTTPGTRVLTVVSAAGATGSATVTLTTTNTTAAGAATAPDVPVAFRVRPAMTWSLSGDHDGHLHSDPIEAGHILLATNTSVTAIASSVSPSGLVVLSGGATTDITVTPVANASGTATVTVIGTDGVLGGAVTNTVTLLVRPVVRVQSLAPSPLSFPEKGSGNVSFTVNSCYAVTAGQCSFSFVEPYLPYNIVSNAPVTVAGTSSGTLYNFTTTFSAATHQYPNPLSSSPATLETYAYGSLVSTARVTVASGAYTNAMGFTINVTAVPHPPRL
ncbi:MAG: hypothetical protein FWF84_00190, partial [Kiritimatiellaeota bacterium]|nr:hypothetical protein [Kiritimatiellota bacterium]